MSETTEVKIHFLDYWRKVRARLGLITLVFLMVVVTAAVVTYFLPRQYLAKVTMEVRPDDDKAIMMFGAGAGHYDPQFAATQFQILKKSEILNPVIQQLKLTESYGFPGPALPEQKTLWRLIKSLQLQEVRNTGLIDIGVLDTEPKRAAQIANTIARVHQDRRMDDLQNSLTRALSQFKDEVDKRRVEVVEAAKDAARIRAELGVIDPDPEVSSAPISGGEHDTQMSESAVNEQANRVANLRTVLSRIEALGPGELMEALRTLDIEDPTVLKTMPLLQDASAEEAKLLKTGLGENHPRIKGLRALEAAYQKTLSDALQSIRHAQATKLKVAEDTLDALQSKLKDSRGRAVAEKGKTSQYTDAKTKYLQAKRIVEAAEMQLSAERMKKAIDFDPAHIWESAVVPIAPSTPNVVGIMSLAIVIGLGLGLCLAFFIEYLDTSVKTVDDVERFLQIPVLAMVPQNIPVLMKLKGEHKDAEAYRIMRASMEFNKPTPDARTITLISGGAGEGKSTTLNNLAFTCVKGGYRVLVVDADLRRPTQHLMFDTDNRFGLVDYLTGDATIEQIIRTTKIDNLFFVPSGILTDNNLGLVNSQRMTDLVHKLKEKYDLVFFDAPPILAVSDGSVLASEMDMTIMVIQHRRFPRAMLQRVKQSVQQVGGSLIGAVLNNVDKRNDDAYGYYNSYDQYYSAPVTPAGSAPTPEHRQATVPRKPVSVVLLIATMPTIKPLIYTMTRLRTFLLSATALVVTQVFSFGQSAMLKPGDSFEMRLGGVPIEYAQDFAIPYTVYDDGTISIPFVGSIRAAGLSMGQLSKAIEQKLVADKIFTSPTISLNQQAQSRSVTIGGGVRVPQAIMWTSDLTLSAGIKRAGGPGDFSNLKKIKVIRDGKVTMYNLTKADKDPTQNPKLLSGDEVDVGE